MAKVFLANLNLVVNAIDAMADMPSDDRVISIRTSRVDKLAELAISDHGPGIPEDKLKEVFEPFFQTLRVVRRCVRWQAGVCALYK